MSDILDQLAGIKILLQEQAEDCRQRARYEQERRETADKQRAKTDVLEASVWENLKKIMDRREDILSQEKPVECEPELVIKLRMTGLGAFKQLRKTSIFLCNLSRKIMRIKCL
jgi:hypothetical protein